MNLHMQVYPQVKVHKKAVSDNFTYKFKYNKWTR